MLWRRFGVGRSKCQIIHVNKVVVYQIKRTFKVVSFKWFFVAWQTRYCVKLFHAYLGSNEAHLVSSTSHQITLDAVAGNSVQCCVCNKAIPTVFFSSRLNDYANLIRNAVLTTMNETRVSEQPSVSAAGCYIHLSDRDEAFGFFVSCTPPCRALAGSSDVLPRRPDNTVPDTGAA